MLLLSKNSNKFDYYLFIIIISLVFGAFGGFLQVSRVVGVLLLPQLIMVWPHVGRNFSRIASYIKLFLIYATLSFIWTPDVSAGFKEILYYIIHFILFFEVLTFSCMAKDNKLTIAKSWIMLVSITLVIAYWEIITGNHLSIAFQDASDMKIASYGLRRFASVTFGNYNAYVTFLCFSFPFLLYTFSNKNKSTLETFWVSFVMVLSFSCILINASRGGVVAIPLMFLIYLIMSRKSFVFSFPVLLISILALIAVNYYSDFLFSVFDDRVETGGFANDDVRNRIWTVALGCFLNSGGFGVGIGGVESAFYSVTHKLMAPHNMFVEVLMEFGIFIFLIFLISIVITFIKGRKSYDKGVRIVSNCFFISLPIVAIIDSSYCLSPLTFVVFASVYSFVFIPRANFNKKS